MTNLNLFNTTGFNTDAVTTVLRAAFTTDGVDKDDPNQAFVATPDARVWGFHPASLVADAIEGCKIGAGDTDMKESFMKYVNNRIGHVFGGSRPRWSRMLHVFKPSDPSSDIFKCLDTPAHHMFNCKHLRIAWPR